MHLLLKRCYRKSNRFIPYTTTATLHCAYVSWLNTEATTVIITSTPERSHLSEFLLDNPRTLQDGRSNLFPMLSLSFCTCRAWLKRPHCMWGLAVPHLRSHWRGLFQNSARKTVATLEVFLCEELSLDEKRVLVMQLRLLSNEHDASSIVFHYPVFCFSICWPGQIISLTVTQYLSSFQV